MKPLRMTLLVTLALALFSGHAGAQRFQVIVNNENPATLLQTQELSALFLKTESKWPNGTIVEPVDLPTDSAVREDFSSHVHGRTAR